VTPARAVAAAFAVSALGSIGLVVAYVFGGHAQVEGVLLALALGGLGVGIVIWAIQLLEAPIAVEERHPLASTPDEIAETRSAADIDAVTRRRFLVRLLAGAGALLAAALAIPTLSLGPGPGRALFTTAWRSGSRVVDESGAPIRPEDVGLGSVRTVFPEGAIGHADAATLLVRVDPSDLRLEGARAGWAPEGVIGYSKICTHAGCPVGLYRAEDHALLCPCHQSTFDVLRGAVPTFGPAARPLPQLPMEVDAQGYLVAMGDFPEPVGPSFWNVTHTDGADLAEHADVGEQP
jgi:ubiquinol-cytochrome c reductase iron-sulfur subunit